MLEVIESDFARLEADTEASEASASKQFDEFMTDSKVDKAQKYPFILIWFWYHMRLRMGCFGLCFDVVSRPCSIENNWIKNYSSSRSTQVEHLQAKKQDEDQELVQKNEDLVATQNLLDSVNLSS